MIFPLVASDILIDVLRKEPLAVSLLESLLRQGAVTVSVVSRMETIQGCLNREMQQQAERLLKRLNLVGLDARIATRADQLVTKYFLSHKLVVADALIAATAIEYDLPPLSKNQKDYRFLANDGLQLLPYPTA
jgi:predicted nucleic acid-binding protein